jgi:hypothetical protein
MSELGDTIAALDAQQRRLDEHDAKLEAQDAKLAEHDRAHAEADRMEQHLVNLIEGLRDQVVEGFRRMREARGNGTR